MADTVIILEACEPMELMRNPTEYDVFIKLLPINRRTGWHDVAIKGDIGAIQDYVALHWGEEVNADIMDRYGFEH